jgi:nicotinate-nucleotide adenylyltransferase
MTHPVESYKTRTVIYYGGSFDPPHYGHLWLIDWLRLALDPVEIIVAPTFEHPWKPDLRNYAQRERWMHKAIGNRPNVRVLFAPEPYTHDTIARLRSGDYRNDRIQVILGTDIIASLDKWTGFDQLTKIADPIFVARKGVGVPPRFPYAVVHPDLPAISSTQIRKWISEENTESLRHYVPAFIVDELMREREGR